MSEFDVVIDTLQERIDKLTKMDSGDFDNGIKTNIRMKQIDKLKAVIELYKRSYLYEDDIYE